MDGDKVLQRATSRQRADGWGWWNHKECCLAESVLVKKSLWAETRHYNERHHGKGPMDGVDGTVKNVVWQSLTVYYNERHHGKGPMDRLGGTFKNVVQATVTDQGEPH